QCRQSIVLALGPTKFNRDILAFNVSGSVQAVTKRGDVRRPRSRRLAGEKPDYRDRPILRTRRERNGQQANRNASNERSPLTGGLIRCLVAHSLAGRQIGPITCDSTAK